MPTLRCWCGSYTQPSSWCDLRDTILTPVRGRSHPRDTRLGGQEVDCESLWGQRPCGRGKRVVGCLPAFTVQYEVPSGSKLTPMLTV